MALMMKEKSTSQEIHWPLVSRENKEGGSLLVPPEGAQKLDC